MSHRRLTLGIVCALASSAFADPTTSVSTPRSPEVARTRRKMIIAGASLAGLGGALMLTGGSFAAVAADASYGLTNPATPPVPDAVLEDRRDTYNHAAIGVLVTGAVVTIAGVSLAVAGVRRH